MMSYFLAAIAMMGAQSFSPDAGNPAYIKQTKELSDVSMKAWKACLEAEAVSYASGDAAADLVFDAAVGKCAAAENRMLAFFEVAADARKIRLSASHVQNFRLEARQAVRPQIIAIILDHRK